MTTRAESFRQAAWQASRGDRTAEAEAPVTAADRRPAPE